MPLPADGTKVKLGKGSLLLNTLSNAGASSGFDFVGNVTALTIAAEVTKAQLFSSTQRSAPLIAEAVTRIAYTLSATLSEFQLGNIKRFMLGEQTSRVQAAASFSADFTGDEVVPGRYLDFQKRQGTSIVVTRDGSIPMVLGTDYLLYAEFGLIKILEDGDIEAGDDVTISGHAPALTIDTVRLAKEATPIVHLLYLADDANQDADGSRDRLEIWRASIAPQGEMNLISDEYGSFQLTMGVLSDAANHPDDPFGTLERVRAA